jgi:hypothetical protein
VHSEILDQFSDRFRNIKQLSLLIYALPVGHADQAALTQFPRTILSNRNPACLRHDLPILQPDRIGWAERLLRRDRNSLVVIVMDALDGISPDIKPYSGYIDSLRSDHSVFAVVSTSLLHVRDN